MVPTFKSFYVIFLGMIIGTIPEECAADAISMVKARNEEIEEREKEKENQKVQEENQKAKMEREKILELLENVMISLKSIHCKNTVTQSSFCSKL
jgi:hypothetical protein